MKEGSIFTVIQFPASWPLSYRAIIFQETIDDSIISIYGNQEAQIEIEIDHITFRSQSIIFTLPNRCLLSILWNFTNESKIECFINSVKIENANHREIFYVKSNQAISDNRKSLDYEQASVLCEPWISWRLERYGSQKAQPKKDRTLKSLEQQVQELNDSLISLEHCLSHFRGKERLFLINVLPHLRSLLFWADKNTKNYNPLFFRIAGSLNLALPIFAFKDRIKDTLNDELFLRALIHRVHNYPSITRENPRQEIMDFQEWINMEVIVERLQQGQQVYRLKDILFESANTISAAHFDDDIPILIENLLQSVSWDESVFYKYIVTITEMTLVLGRYIISKSSQSGS
jgi:hypothetical protein